MLTKRDKEILKFIEKYKSITIRQAKYLFFKKSYEGARRRLAELEKFGLLKSSISKARSEKVFYAEKMISDHDLYKIDYIVNLKKMGFEIIEFNSKPSYFDNQLKPDAFVVCRKNGYRYITFLEIDYTHYTSNTKMNTLYEKLAREDFRDTGFILVVARPTKGIRYSPTSYDIVFTDLEFSNLSAYIY
ncbi:hypothetical protein [Clostridium perfringens]|uniref:hypothetical protein n=1 Tax=Clostridium perfringens TaxID=1502 RepID=UPI0018E429CE|nr:hypothetical protein [Clostridium perfringens]MBI5987319.1 hypothetical protein [Clostridium perfringens]MBI6054717.1 hypothetical protein [Clostridium perfringens]MDK0672305.1 hypothetical protein [Clostridium perfringens]MDK0850242.1 hypothetical protein [Clostridium perfringens]